MLGRPDFYPVLVFVVLSYVDVGIVQLHTLQVLEGDVFHLVIAGFAVVGHDDLPTEFSHQNIPLFLLWLALMQTVDLVDELKDGLVAHYFFGGVHSQVETSFEVDKVRLVPAEHHKIVDFFLFLCVEVFPCAPNLHIVQLAHHTPQAVVKERQQHLWVVLH